MAMSREIIFLLDRSSNMAGKEAEVIAEYNAFLLQNGRGDYNVTTVLFDDQYVLLYYGPVDKVAKRPILW
jgi:Xaa-Pro aminopeptidase